MVEVAKLKTQASAKQLLLVYVFVFVKGGKVFVVFKKNSK